MTAGRPILVVTGEAATREFLELALRVEGYAVEGASDGASALVRAAATRPALIVLDSVIPDMDAPTFGHAYRSTDGPHGAILLLTTEPDAAAAARHAGAAAHLEMPFEVDRLFEILAKLVAESRDPGRDTGRPG